ncbi:MAG: hypothetical protein ACRDV9_03955, partial [Acidimicrobiia bacterium]
LGPPTFALGGEGGFVRRTGRGADAYIGNPMASGGGVLFEAGCHLVDQLFTICQAQDFELGRCEQVRFQGLEHETSASGFVGLSGGARLAFSVVVSSLHDVYNGIVIGFRDGQIRLDTTPEASVEIWRGSLPVARVGTPSQPVRELLAAHRRQWEGFISGCRSGSVSTLHETGILTTEFLQDCYHHPLSSRAGTPVRPAPEL